MHFSTTTVASALLAAAGSALAQDVNVQVVSVGRATNGSSGLVFSPEEVTAPAGSMVQFQFWPRNHSVVQSTFGQPCMPITFNQPNATGLYSGFMPVAEGDAMMPTYTIMINDTQPIWLYCSQGQHCQSGMGMVINPPQNNPERTLAAYKQLAGASPENLSPGQMPSAGANGTVPSPTGGSGSGGSGGVGGGVSPDATNSPPAPSGSPAASVDQGAAASLYAGSSAVVAVLSALAFFAL